MRPESDRKPESYAAFRTRTFDFGIRCIRLVEALPKGMTARVIGHQLLRAATSVGANYRAAIRGRSRADFVAKMGTVEEECDEALHWLEVLLALGIVAQARVEDLQKEGNEILVFTVSSIKTARKNAKT